jgi:hypothetical protein
MNSRSIQQLQSLTTVWLAVLCLASVGLAQTTAFTYQGKLTDAGNPANGTYDLQLRLLDAVSGGTPQGSPVTLDNVSVANGVFTVQLDFGAAAFPGAARWLEIGVRPGTSTGAFTTLTPRQLITPAPYAMHSGAADGLSAACVNCITSSQIQTVDGTQVSGAIPVESVPTGSENYIQNATVARGNGKTGGQPAASFDIGGNGNIGGNLTVVGQTGLGTTTPGPGLNLDVVGNSRMTTANGTLNFGSPNAETGMTIITPQVRADFRVNSAALKLVAGVAGFVPPGTNGIAIDAAGNVGVGTEAPGGGIKLDITGVTRMNFPNGVMQFGTPNTEFAGMTFSGNAGRADLRWNGTLKLVNGPGGIPSAANGIAINTAGNVGIGTEFPTAKLHIVGTSKTSVLEITGGSDLAEHFDVAEGVKAGFVVAIDPRQAGKLTLARGAYNRRVAGIISGANNLSAGMVLPDAGGARQSMPVALTGRVWVYCDTANAPIRPGDLLTTSSSPGHAMKVTNYARAQGAVIGKAMTGLKAGKGLVLVLVSLQ